MYKEFRKQLMESPGDFGLRGVFADFLQEQDDPFAKVQKWLIEKRKHPCYWQDIVLWGIESNNFPELLPCRLPVELFIKINKIGSGWIYCDDMEQAERLLAEVLI